MVAEKKHLLEACLVKEEHESDIAKQNTAYIIHEVLARGDAENVVTMFENDLSVRKNLEGKLNERHHTHRVFMDEAQYSGIPKNVYRLSPRQLLRVYLLMEALETDATRRRIGYVLENDISDQESEHGGLVVFNGNSKLTLHAFQSALAGVGDPEIDEMYLLPENARKTPHIAEFHCHAEKENEARHAGPSLDDFELCKDIAKQHGESQNIVITKLAGPRFNVVYYGKEQGTRSNRKRVVALDLGDYAWE